MNSKHQKNSRMCLCRKERMQGSFDFASSFAMRMNSLRSG